MTGFGTFKLPAELGDFALYPPQDEERERSLVPRLEEARWPCDEKTLLLCGINEQGLRYVRLKVAKGMLEFVEADDSFRLTALRVAGRMGLEEAAVAARLEGLVGLNYARFQSLFAPDVIH